MVDTQRSEGEWLMEIKGPTDVVVRCKDTSADEADGARQLDGGMDEALDFLKRHQSAVSRSRISLRLCLNEPTDTVALTRFLEEVAQLTAKPTITLTGCGATPEITELLEKIEGSRTAIAQTIQGPSSDNDNGDEAIVEVNFQTYASARRSPLPALRLEKHEGFTHNPDLTLQAKRPDIHVLCVMDFDNSLYQNAPEHGIILLDFMKFVEANNHDGFRKGHGNRDALLEGIGYCEEWAYQRRMQSQGRAVKDPFDYQMAIVRSDNLSAAGFEGMRIEQLRELAAEFVQNLKGRFFDYKQPILNVCQDYGVLPVLVTGAPHVLVKPLLRKAGMTHGNGLRYELEKNRLTGRVERYRDEITGNETEYHMGISRGKARLCQELILKGYGLAMSFGDSAGDFGLFSSSIRKMPGNKWDWDGGAVLVNGTDDVGMRVEDNYSIDCDQARFQVLRPGVHPKMVTAAFETAMHGVFEARIENLENIKRMRDILTRLGYSDEEKREIMLEHYPVHIVDAAIKEHTVNTKNENDYARHLRRTGVPEEMIASVLEFNRAYYSRKGATLVPLRKQSSFPPPPASDGTKSDGTED